MVGREGSEIPPNNIVETFAKIAAERGLSAPMAVGGEWLTTE